MLQWTFFLLLFIQGFKILTDINVVYYFENPPCFYIIDFLFDWF